MTGAGCWGDHVRDKLVVPCATHGLQNADALVRIESRILTAVAEVNEIRGGIMQKAVRIGFDLEVVHQPKGLTLENAQMAIKAGDI